VYFIELERIVANSKMMTNVEQINVSLGKLTEKLKKNTTVFKLQYYMK
jgi:hypothetical protein